MRRRSRAGAEGLPDEPDPTSGWAHDEPIPLPVDRYEPIPALRLPRLFSLPVLAASLVVALVGGIASGYFLAHRATTFSSTAVLSIDQPRAVADAANNGPLQKLIGLRGEYAAFASTDLIAVPVASQLGLPTALVRRSVHAAPAGVGLLLAVRATTRDRSLAVELASTAASQIVALAQSRQADAKVPTELRYSFQIVVPAQGAAAAKTDKERRAVLGAVVFAVLLLAGGGLSVAVARRI
jgi:hypothetical protein